MLYRCPVCDIPMFEKVGLKLFFQRKQAGQIITNEIDRTDSEGTMKIKCGKCKESAHILVQFHEVVTVEEKIVDTVK